MHNRGVTKIYGDICAVVISEKCQPFAWQAVYILTFLCKGTGSRDYERPESGGFDPVHSVVLIQVAVITNF